MSDFNADLDEVRMIAPPYYLDVVSEIESTERIASTGIHFAIAPPADEMGRVAARLGLPVDELIAKEIVAHNDGGWAIFVKIAP